MHDHSDSQKKDIELPLLGPTPTDTESPLPKRSRNLDANFSESQPKYNIWGIYFALISTLSSVLVAVIWKWNPALPRGELFVWRSVFACPLAYLLIKKYDSQLTINELFGYHNVKVGLIATISILTYFLSLLGLTVSETTTIYATLGIFNGIFGLLFLQETYPTFERILGGVCFVGVVLIVRPPFIFGEDEQSGAKEMPISRFLAAIICIISTALWSLIQIILRATTVGCSKYAMLFQNNFQMGVIAFIYCMMNGGLQSLGFQGYFTAFLMCLCNLSVTYCIIRALEYEKPSVVGLVSYSEIIFAILADLFIFHIFPSFLALIGMSIIMACCFLLIKKAQ